MKFTAEKYATEVKPMSPFIDPEEIWNYLNNTKSQKKRVHEVITKSLDNQRLNLEVTAVLVNVDEQGLIEEIKKGAHSMKEKVYGNRIVLFAPLFIGNKCTNNCTYCGFRTDNKGAVRKTLSNDEIIEEVYAMEDNGQKRLILVYGDHPEYSADFIAQNVKTVYATKKGRGEIRKENINAAPLDTRESPAFNGERDLYF